MEQIDVLEIIQAIIDRNKHDGCTLCAYYDKEPWNEPCRFCKRNCHDYWKYKGENNV